MEKRIFSRMTWLWISVIILVFCIAMSEAAPVNEYFPATDLISAAISMIPPLPEEEGYYAYTLPSKIPMQTFREDIWYTKIDYPSDWEQSDDQEGSLVLFESSGTMKGAIVAIATPVVTGYENTPEGLRQLQDLAKVRIKKILHVKDDTVKDITFMGLPGKEVQFTGKNSDGETVTLGIAYTVIDHRIYEIDYLYSGYYPKVDIPLFATMIDSFTLDYSKEPSVLMPSGKSVYASSDQNPVISIESSLTATNIGGYADIPVIKDSSPSDQNPLILIEPSSTTTGIGGYTDVSVVMDSAPSGLSGYQITVSLTDPSLGVITDVTQPGWAGLFSTTPLPGSSVTIKAADTALEIGPGATSIFLTTCTIEGTKEGQCTVMIQPDMVDDDESGRYNPDTRQGTITVSGDGPQTPFTLDLYPGWNFISTPRQLAQGHDTATIFSGVETQGRSIWLYNAQSGSWISAESSTQIEPYQGIWIFSGDLASVSLLFKENSPVEGTTLEQGWNSIGPVSLTSESAKTTFSTISSSWTQVLEFNAPVQAWDPAIVNGGTGQFSDNRLIKPGQGYWIYMTEKAHLTVR